MPLNPTAAPDPGAHTRAMLRETPLMQRLGLKHPIIQAPMAGGGDTPALVAAVCEAGGLGCIGAAYSTPDQIHALAQEVRKRTSAPFGVNLFATPELPEFPEDPGPSLARVAPFYAELGLPPPSLPPMKSGQFAEQLAAVRESGAAVFSFTFGTLPATAIDAIKGRGMFVMGTATTVDEALDLQRAGVDAVIAQGSEAGGHRGTFRGEFEASLIGTMALVPQMADAISLPAVASGGIMDGRGVAAALALGAQAVQLGTAFLTCEEAGVPDVYKQAILSAHENDTGLTSAFSGRPARGIVNRFMTAGRDAPILPFPYQNAITRPLRAEAARRGDASLLSLWAGQGVRLARRGRAGDLVRALAEEAGAVLELLGTG
jgi:nitronate monooxygenase